MTTSPNPWDLSLSGQNVWRYNEDTRTEDKAPQGCDLSVNVHLLALESVHAIKFGRYIASATTPFPRDDLQEVRINGDAVVRRRGPRYQEVYACRGWPMFPGIERVYINDRARMDLDWRPRYDFAHIVDLLHAGEDPRSSLTRAVGSRGYHANGFADGPYPVE